MRQDVSDDGGQDSGQLSAGGLNSGAVDEFVARRPRLFAIAYRMLGSAADAEDVVQDAYLRWSQTSTDAIVSPAAWLTKVVTNLCLNRLDSARVKREQYVGMWLPEPVVTDPTVAGSLVPPSPLEAVQRDESVSIGVLVLLERLRPAERAVFVLREAFGYPHAEIADVLGISVANSQQLLTRARSAVGDQARFPAPPDVRRELTKEFLAAARGGDRDRLERLLAADITVRSDGGGRVPAARVGILGAAKVARYLCGSFGRLDALTDFPMESVVTELNGAPAIVVQSKTHLITTISLSFDESTDDSPASISSAWIVANPEKLAFAAAQLNRRPLSAALVERLLVRHHSRPRSRS